MQQRLPLVLTALAVTSAGAAFLLAQQGAFGIGHGDESPFGIHVGQVTGEPLPIDTDGISPEPTEVASAQDESGDQKRAREEWIESMHKAPGVDWRAIDRGHRTELALARYADIENGLRTSNWTEVGSANQAGHSRSACPSPDGSRLYIGSANGGSWRGDIDGTNWSPISDGLGYEVNQILVASNAGGTGEILHILSNEGGVAQLHSSTDDGATWFVPTHLPTDFYEAKRMVRDVSQPGRVYLLTRARNTWEGGGGFDYGFLLYRSDDGGLDWDMKYVFPANPRADVWIDRQAGGAVWVLSGNTLHRSLDGGLTFTQIGTVPTTGTVNDVILDASEAGAPSFYGMIKESGAYKLYGSSNGGVTWTLRHTPSDMWDQMMVSISDPNTVFFGGVECWRSVNGGSTFNKINSWGAYYGDPANRLHADIRGLDAAMVGAQPALFINTDGGTYVSYDNGATVQNLCLQGVGISQYYDTYTSGTDPYLVLGGAQDQGYQQSLPGQGTPYLQFSQLISGDYAHIVSTVRDHNLAFCVYPGFILLQKQEAAPQGLLNLGDFPTPNHLWLPPLCADPDVVGTFYFLGDGLYKYERIGTSYSFDITLNPQDFGSGSLSGMCISPADSDYWYLTMDSGQLWFSHDAGATFTNPARGPNGHWFHGTSIVGSPNDRDLAYVGGSGYLGHPVWKTTDGGATWEGIGDGLPNTLVYELVLGGVNQDELFAATEVGAYRYDSNLGTWESIMGTEAPLTTYWGVEWVPEINSVRFGTYGRGMWDYALTDPADVADYGQSNRTGLALRTSPNPARSEVAFSFDLPADASVTLELFDVHGRRLDTVDAGSLGAGHHDLPYRMEESWARGTYLARLRAGDRTDVRKIQLVD